MSRKPTVSLVLPSLVLLMGVGAYYAQRPRAIAAVVVAQATHDSVKDRIAALGSLSRQDTTVLRRQAMTNAQEIAVAEVQILDSINTPHLMLSVDSLARQNRLTSGPLMPDTGMMGIGGASAPYGAETFSIRVTGTWGDLVAFLGALPNHAGGLFVVPAVRSLAPTTLGERTLVANVVISVITRHPRGPVSNEMASQANDPSSSGRVTPSLPAGAVPPIG